MTTPYAERPHLTAPEPTTTITGTAAVITGVRFTWSLHCMRCRRSMSLYADGGRIEVGIKTDLIGKGARGGGRVKDIPRSRWYEKPRPPARPVPPECCPLCGADRWFYSNDWRDYTTPWYTVQGHRAISAVYDALRGDPVNADAVARADDAMRSDQARRNRQALR